MKSKTYSKPRQPSRLLTPVPEVSEEVKQVKETQRLFIGFPVELPSGLQAALKRAKISAKTKDMEFYWPPASNLHVTFCFLGETRRELVPKIEAVLAHVAENYAPLESDLRGLGAFPDDHHMRVLYAGVRKARRLTILQARLQDALVEAGFPQDKREFKPHLTIGRLRKSRSGRDLISPYVRTQFGKIRIENLHLFESVMQGSHAVYKILSTHRLAGQLEDITDDARDSLETPEDED